MKAYSYATVHAYVQLMKLEEKTLTPLLDSHSPHHYPHGPLVPPRPFKLLTPPTCPLQ